VPPCHVPGLYTIDQPERRQFCQIAGYDRSNDLEYGHHRKAKPELLTPQVKAATKKTKKSRTVARKKPRTARMIAPQDSVIWMEKRCETR
jgi:hypothetical protein